jgi:DNA-binding XRE family transcriptional regulator
MALDELTLREEQLTQADMAEMLDVPQSSISRIEQRADMYLSTLRNYVHAMGGALQIQAVFPDGGTIVIDRFGEYEEQSYFVWAGVETGGKYRLGTRPLDQGAFLSTKVLTLQAFKKTLRALHIPEAQIVDVRTRLEKDSRTEIGGRFAQRVFSAADLIAAGFETTGASES